MGEEWQVRPCLYRRPMDSAAFRAEFPVLDRSAYLNAGTDGPVPLRAAAAAQEALELELRRGRSGEVHIGPLMEAKHRVRARLAECLGCTPADVALSHSTTDGMNCVLSGLELGPGDEVLTSDEEHPGLLAPLAAARERRGFSVRTVPFAAIAGELGKRTKLVACSHVSWVNGQVVDAAALAASDALVLLDGAQGIGAITVDVVALGCDFYAGAGQKWLCGPDGSGCLFVRPDRRDALGAPWPGYESLAEPARALELPLHASARRFDIGPAPGPLVAWWLASLDLMAELGWDRIAARGTELAAGLAGTLAERGLDVAERGPSTLVSWRAQDPGSLVKRGAGEGVVIRELPGTGLVRASVGAWSTEEDLQRLLAVAAG